MGVCVLLNASPWSPQMTRERVSERLGGRGRQRDRERECL